MSGRDGELARVIPFPGSPEVSSSAGRAVAPTGVSAAGVSAAVQVRSTTAPAPSAARARTAQRPTRTVRPGRVRGCSVGTVRSGGLRLTRRGRLVLAGALLLAPLFAVVFGVGLGSVAGASMPEHTSTVRVEQGETLWGIARQVDSDADVRQVVRWISELNGLAPGEQLSPGQRLTVPDSS